MQTTTTIAYTTFSGGNYLAMISEGKITHVPDGDWSRAFTSDRIDYVTSSGERYVAKLENGQFLHARNGDFSEAHYSNHLDYQDWDGQSYFATLEKDLFTFGQSASKRSDQSEPEHNGSTVFRGKWIFENTLTETKSRFNIVSDPDNREQIHGKINVGGEIQINSCVGFNLDRGHTKHGSFDLKQFQDLESLRHPPATCNLYHVIKAAEDAENKTVSHSPRPKAPPYGGQSGLLGDHSIIDYVVNFWNGLINKKTKPKEIKLPNAGKFLAASDDMQYQSHAIYGSEGTDIITGSQVHDYLEGRDGDDTLYGRGGGDVFIGGAGDDWLAAEGGRNNLTGGEGADTFEFKSLGATDSNTITDFWGNDRIWLSNSNLNPSGTNINDLKNGKNFAKDETYNLGSSSGFRYLQSQGQLFYDSDGGDFSSGGQLIATLQNKPIIETFNHTGIFIS